MQRVCMLSKGLNKNVMCINGSSIHNLTMLGRIGFHFPLFYDKDNHKSPNVYANLLYQKVRVGCRVLVVAQERRRHNV